MRIKQIFETPIAATDDPNNPVVKHGKANPMELKLGIFFISKALSMPNL